MGEAARWCVAGVGMGGVGRESKHNSPSILALDLATSLHRNWRISAWREHSSRKPSTQKSAKPEARRLYVVTQQTHSFRQTEATSQIYRKHSTYGLSHGGGTPLQFLLVSAVHAYCVPTCPHTHGISSKCHWGMVAGGSSASRPSPKLSFKPTLLLSLSHDTFMYYCACNH